MLGKVRATDKIRFPVKNVPSLEVQEKSFENSIMRAELKPTETRDIKRAGHPFRI